MATFLTTERMNPALRARVERAVSTRARAVHNAARMGLDRPFAGRERLRVARLFPILVAALVGVLGVVMYVRDRRAVEAERAALLGALADRRGAVPPGHEGALGAMDRWIVETAKSGAAPDVIDPALREKGALDAWLRRPSVFVRGPVAELGDAAKVDGAARGSIKDAFLVCLLSPPPSSSEKDLLAKVRGVYFGGAKVDAETASVRRLADARLGLPVLSPAFEAAARASQELRDLVKLRRELDAAPLDQAAKAAAADLLIVVADVPHGDARVALVDLGAKKVLFSARRRVEEQGTSPMASLHRSELEACSLAFTVRKTITE